jgi:hypothetical protein
MNDSPDALSNRQSPSNSIVRRRGVERDSGLEGCRSLGRPTMIREFEKELIEVNGRVVSYRFHSQVIA